MKICFFGIYNPDYSRNRVLLTGLRMSGHMVTECRVDPKVFSGFSKYWQLFKQGREIKKQKPDLVIVGFPGQTVVWVARMLFGKKIVFDAFLSLYDSNVFDRKLYHKYSFRAFRDWFFDWLSCTVSQIVLLDTFEHIKYFEKTFRISQKKMIRVFVGSDYRYNPTQKSHSDILQVHFHGSYIPLHGIEYIIEAARLLEDEKIHFTIIGEGQESSRIKEIITLHPPKNITFKKSVPSSELPQHIAAADVCLGIFGQTPKADRVIPNKIFEALALKKPIVTGESQAVHELLKDGETVILGRRADAKDLAQKIRFLRAQPELRDNIAEAGHKLFLENLTPQKLVSKLMNDIHVLLFSQSS